MLPLCQPLKPRVRAMGAFLGVLVVLGSVALVFNSTLVSAQVTPADLRNMALSRTNSLKTVPVQDAPTFKQFVADRVALQKLGKALFWDQQVGSDGQACASCHYHAGADNRSKNQLNPGFRGGDFVFGDPTQSNPAQTFGPNYQLQPGDFPFHQVSPVDINPELNPGSSQVTYDTDTVVSSQGVFNAKFTGLSGPPIGPKDKGTLSTTLADGVHANPFIVGTTYVRNVEPRNTPTVINSPLNNRNFWDTRAQRLFNGNDPLGSLDPTTRLVMSNGKNNAVLVQQRIGDSSAASQADGPPGSDLEMSYAGRSFPVIGRKMFALTPLGQQSVDPNDSLLGPYRAGPQGVTFKYKDLIKKAIDPTWSDFGVEATTTTVGWIVDVTDPSKPVVKQAKLSDPSHQFTAMEYNFALYFGLAVNEYEKLLIANNTPFDQFMEGNDNALTPSAQGGLLVFLTQGKCISCHSGPELTNASLTNVQGFEIIERMIMGDDRVAVYDNGIYNIGVRPTLEDIGIGATIGPKNLPLSASRFFQQCMTDPTNPCTVPRILARPGEAAKLLTKAAALQPGTGAEALIQHALDLLALVPPDPTGASCALMYNAALLCPTTPVTNPDGTTTTVPVLGAYDLLAAALSPPAGLADLLAAAKSLLPDLTSPSTAPKLLAPVLQPNERVAVDGAMKAPSVRTSELTAPYFHNGGVATLEQVVEFYNRGGNFPVTNKDNLDVDIQPLFLTDQQKSDLVAFLKSLTDERVRFEQDPFDHPSLCIPNGGNGDTTAVAPQDPLGVFSPGAVSDVRLLIPAVGAGGNGVSLGTDNSPSANFLQTLSGSPCP